MSETPPFLFVHSAVDDAGLTPVQFRVMGHLSRRAGTDGLAYCSNESIGKVCGISLPTVKKAIRDLRARCVLVPEFRQGRTTLNRINQPALWQPDPVKNLTQVENLPMSKRSGRGGKESRLGAGKNLSQEVGKKLTHKGNPLKGIPHKEIQKKEIQTASPSSQNWSY